MASGGRIHNRFPSTMVSGTVPPGPWYFLSTPQWDVSWSALLRKCSFKCNFYELLSGCLFSPRLPSSPLLRYSAIPNQWNANITNMKWFSSLPLLRPRKCKNHVQESDVPHLKSSRKRVHAGAGSGLGAWSQGRMSPGRWGLGPRLSGWWEQDAAEAGELPLAT